MSLLLLTDRRQATRPLPWVVARAVDGGARTVVLREKDLPRPERLALATQLRDLLRRAGGTLVVAGPDPLGADAVHLAAADPVPPGVRLVGRSCHDAGELARLSTEDYVTVSPVFPSASKPGYGPALGPAGLAALVALTRTPVYALGGIAAPVHAVACREAGAGIAVMGAVMRAPDPAVVVASLLAAVPS